MENQIKLCKKYTKKVYISKTKSGVTKNMFSFYFDAFQSNEEHIQTSDLLRNVAATVHTLISSRYHFDRSIRSPPPMLAFKLPSNHASNSFDHIVRSCL